MLSIYYFILRETFGIAIILYVVSEKTDCNIWRGSPRILLCNQILYTLYLFQWFCPIYLITLWLLCQKMSFSSAMHFTNLCFWAFRLFSFIMLKKFCKIALQLMFNTCNNIFVKKLCLCYQTSLRLLYSISN